MAPPPMGHACCPWCTPLCCLLLVRANKPTARLQTPSMPSTPRDCLPQGRSCWALVMSLCVTTIGEIHGSTCCCCCTPMRSTGGLHAPTRLRTKSLSIHVQERSCACVESAAANQDTMGPPNVGSNVSTRAFAVLTSGDSACLLSLA